jgi:hypothetical protein
MSSAPILRRSLSVRGCQPRHPSGPARDFTVQRGKDDFGFTAVSTEHDDIVFELTVDDRPSRVEAGNNNEPPAAASLGSLPTSGTR